MRSEQGELFNLLIGSICSLWVMGHSFSRKNEEGRWIGAEELLSTLLPEVGTPELAPSFPKGRKRTQCENRGKQSPLLP